MNDHCTTIPNVTRIDGATLRALGVHGMTDIFCHTLTDKERVQGKTHGDTRRPALCVRMGIAILGHTNMTTADLEACDGGNPFHENFYDNYVEGTGNTIDEALHSMQADIFKISEGLFA